MVYKAIAMQYLMLCFKEFKSKQIAYVVIYDFELGTSSTMLNTQHRLEVNNCNATTVVNPLLYFVLIVQLV